MNGVWMWTTSMSRGSRPRSVPMRAPPVHATVLRIARHGGGRHAQHARLVAHTARVVQRCYEKRLDPAARQILTEGPDRRRHSVDTRKVHVGNEKDPHVGPLAEMACGHFSERA